MLWIFPFDVTVVLRPEEVIGLVPVCACTDTTDTRLSEKMHKRIALYTFSLRHRSRAGVLSGNIRLMLILLGSRKKGTSATALGLVRITPTL
jgi:hypothetical protein